MTTESNALSKLLIPELEAELKKTRRFLELVPEGHDDFRPHPRSSSLLELANHLATVAGLATAILTTPGADLGGPTDPRRIVKESNPAAILPVFDELAANSLEHLNQTADATFQDAWQATRQGQTLFTGTRYLAYRNIAVNHMIHHRAQLGGYLRSLDIPLPSAFGPSADQMPAK
jgi:uncharacterized damage-inducible protein DinB